MENSMNYTQCLLVKENKDGEVFKTVCWIPSEFAQRYRVLKLKEDNGEWNDGWMVEHSYTTHNEEFVRFHERDFTRQREASDI